GDEVLIPGQNLIVPNKVTNIHNNSTTFRPYNPGEAMGRLDPTLPTPAAPKEGGCGTAGMILMIVVAVVVTIFTVGAGAVLMGASGSLLSAGTAVLAGTTTLGTVAAVGVAAVGAAVGSAASQLVGMATGNVDKFSWTQVGIAALSAGVTAGVGSIGSSGLASTMGLSGWAAAGANAMIGNVITQQAMRAAGWQDGFKWNQVAAAGAGAAVGSVVGDAIGQLQYTGQGNSPTWSSVQQQLASGQGEQSFIHGFTRQLARNFASGAVSTQLTTHHYRDYQRGLLANAFGDAFANAGVNNYIATRTEAEAASRAQQLAGGNSHATVAAPTDTFMEDWSTLAMAGAIGRQDKAPLPSSLPDHIRRYGEGWERAGGRYVSVRQGDTLSQLAGGNASLIGAMAMANGGSSRLRDGQQIWMPDADTYNVQAAHETYAQVMASDNAAIARVKAARASALAQAATASQTGPAKDALTYLDELFNGKTAGGMCYEVKPQIALKPGQNELRPWNGQRGLSPQARLEHIAAGVDATTSSGIFTPIMAGYVAGGGDPAQGFGQVISSAGQAVDAMGSLAGGHPLSNRPQGIQKGAYPTQFSKPVSFAGETGVSGVKIERGSRRLGASALNGEIWSESAGGTNQYINDLSPYTGSRVQNGNRAISAILKEDFSSLRLTYQPLFSPYAETGVTGYAPFFENPGVQIGYKSLESRAALRDTIIHEELHNRWRYEGGITENHHFPGGDVAYSLDLKYRDMKFYATVERYKSMRGWDYSQSVLDEWKAYVSANKTQRIDILQNHF
ncbi:hypothetical protein HNQ59_003938, partial [Chitinivorax tropicus]